jgi:PAS domain-containing protein/DNA-binding CsgD family transcriptional regulator
LPGRYSMKGKTGSSGATCKPLITDERILHGIIDGSFIPTFVIDRDHCVQHWNRALEEISKIPASSIIGTNEHWRAFYRKQRPCMADLLVDGAMQEIPRWYAGKVRESPLIPEAFEATDFFAELGEGGRWLRFTATLMRNNDGEIVGAVETLEDITDQKLAEEALRESQQRLYQILEGSPIAAFVIDRDHQVIFWNRALEELSRIRADDVVGTDQHWRAFYGSKRPCMADLIIDEKLAEVKKWYAGKGHPSKLLKEAFEATDFFSDLGEGGRWLRFTAAAIRNSQGALVGAVETLEDISERMTAEQALKESEQRLHSILQGSTIPAFVIGKDHRVLFWNKALEELSQIPAREVLGTKQHWRAFYSEERPCMADLLVDGDVKEVPRWYQGKYSKSKLLKDAFEAVDFFPSLAEGKWVRFTAAVIRDAQGIIVGALETLEDITERKRSEIALQNAHDELEQRVEERTMDLLQFSESLKTEIVERKEAEKKLRKRERELKMKSSNLQEVNTAMKVLLDQREQDRREVEETVMNNVKELLAPYLERLKKTKLTDVQLAHVRVLETNLDNIISPFLKTLHSRHLNLTPKEIRVASLIKEGRTTKEIAELLGMSVAAVDFHRNNIRKKLGLRNKKANLVSHLASM